MELDFTVLLKAASVGAIVGIVFTLTMRGTEYLITRIRGR